MLPVFLKAALRVREPVTFRGGELVTLAQKAGRLSHARLSAQFSFPPSLEKYITGVSESG